jgi:hypothetical protein
MGWGSGVGVGGEFFFFFGCGLVCSFLNCLFTMAAELSGLVALKGMLLLLVLTSLLQEVW